MEMDIRLPIAVEVADAQGHLAIDPPALERLARRVLEGEGVGRASVSIALVDDATIHDLNRRHLGHDWPTDVITFPLSDPRDEELAGELIVSAEMAAAMARSVGADPADELALYVVHGLLHLCGHDDRTPEATARMRAREAEVLAREGLANPFGLAGPAPSGRSGREEPSWPV